MSVAAGGASSNAERASERGDPQTADERLREEWDERRKKFHHDRTPPPEVFKDKLFAIIIGTEHCVAVAHEIAYVLEACCGYHHSRVIRLIGDSCTFVFKRSCHVSTPSECAAACLTPNAGMLLSISKRRNNILARLEWCIQSVPTDAKLLIYFGTRLVTPGGVHKREIAAGTTIRTVDNTKTESSDPLASLRSPVRVSAASTTDAGSVLFWLSTTHTMLHMLADKQAYGSVRPTAWGRKRRGCQRSPRSTHRRDRYRVGGETNALLIC